MSQLNFLKKSYNRTTIIEIFISLEYNLLLDQINDSNFLNNIFFRLVNCLYKIKLYMSKELEKMSLINCLNTGISIDNREELLFKTIQLWIYNTS